MAIKLAEKMMKLAAESIVSKHSTYLAECLGSIHDAIREAAENGDRIYRWEKHECPSGVAGVIRLELIQEGFRVDDAKPTYYDITW